MLSNGLRVAKIVVIAYKPIEYLLKRCFSNLFKFDRKQVADRTLNRCLINDYLAGFLSLCKRVGRNTFSGRQLDIALGFQKKKQASADHVFKNTVGLPPIPCPADFLRNKTPAFVRM
jgi:hypothetical protein